MTILKRAAAALMLLALAAAPARALDIDVTTFTLPNGMQVVVIPDHRAPVVTHMVWYKVGLPTRCWASQVSPISSST